MSQESKIPKGTLLISRSVLSMVMNALQRETPIKVPNLEKKC